MVTYGDWYLHSKYELDLLHSQKAKRGDLASDWWCWSSIENNNANAWNQFFSSDDTQSSGVKSSTKAVRAVRAF